MRQPEHDRDGIRLLREDGWIRLRTSGPTQADPWDLLARNARRRGPARFVLAASPGEPPEFIPELVVDLFVADGTESPSGVVQAHALDPEPVVGRAGAAGASPDWPVLVEESGWPVAPRGKDRIAVELDAAGHIAQAQLSGTEDGASVSVEVARTAGASPGARHAMAHFVLILSGQLRMVRASASDDRETIVLDVRLPGTATARDLDLALSALSVGFRFAARELRALVDDRLAALYLDHLHLTRTLCDSTKEPAFSCSM